MVSCKISFGSTIAEFTPPFEMSITLTTIFFEFNKSNLTYSTFSNLSSSIKSFATSTEEFILIFFYL